MRNRVTAFVVCFSFVTLAASAATVDGIRIHSTTRGSGARTLILVHGWTCDETSWAENVPELSKRYRVITLDLPGHGKTGSPKDAITMDLFARAVEAVRAEAKADKVVLVGHSMGTPVIRQYARLYPQHVAGLVAVDGVLRIGGGPARAGGPPPPQADRMRGPEGMKNREAMIRTMFTPATPQSIQQHVLKMMLAAPESTAYGAMTATFDPAVWKDDVMTLPVLGIYADKSALANPEYTMKIFPSFEYREIPGTGHFLMMEKPQEFNQLLMGFVEKIK